MAKETERLANFANPLSRAELETKFRRLAGAVLPKERCDAIIERVTLLDSAHGVGELMALLR